MSDLQTSLIIIGISIVLGVIAYNKWLEYREKKSVERAFSASPDDILMSGGTAAAIPDPMKLEPAFGEAAALSEIPEAVPAAEAPVAATVPAKELPIDDLIDCSIPLVLEAPLRGEKIIPALQSLRYIGSKPVQFIGLTTANDWEPVSHGSVYVELQAGVQLANRTSALNELEYSELVLRLRQIADELGAEPDVPDMTEVMAVGRSLYQFVTEYDAKLSVNIVSSGAPWVIDTLLLALERQGFDLRPDGRLIMPDGDNGILFTLSTNVTLAAQTTSRLTLLLDVPCVAPVRDGFGAMVACARSLAMRLAGTVVDDTGQPLADAALGEIAAQLQAFYSNMEAAGIPAGSARALRLFS